MRPPQAKGNGNMDKKLFRTIVFAVLAAALFGVGKLTRLFDGLKSAVLEAGNRIVFNDTFVLYLAKKPLKNIQQTETNTYDT